MGISLVTFAGQTVTPQDDALIYEAALKESGFIYGGTVTLQSANVLNVAASHGVIQGRKFTIESTDVAVALSSSGTLSGRLYIHMDLSDSDTPIQLMTETGNSLTPEVQNTDVNINPGVYEINIATFDIDTSTISNLVNVAPYISKELDTELSTTSANPVINSAITKALGTPETIGGSASQAYAKGDLLLGSDGQIYVATAAISQGNNISDGGNVSTTDSLVSQISNIPKYIDTTISSNSGGGAEITNLDTDTYKILSISSRSGAYVVSNPYNVGLGSTWCMIYSAGTPSVAGNVTLDVRIFYI